MGSRHYVIIGNGISGITFARHLRKGNAEARITVISGESPYFFSRTALMYVFMGQMKWDNLHPYEPHFWEKNRIHLFQGWVNSVDFDAKRLLFSSGESLTYDVLVLATGSKPALYDWPGQELKGVQGLYSKQDLELMEENTQKSISRAVVVGGGLIGVEMAEMLAYKGIPVTFLVRESRYGEQFLPQEEAEMIKRHIEEHGIDLRLETSLKELLPDDQGQVRAILTTSGEEIPCEFVGLSTGVRPNVDFLKSSRLSIKKGIQVNSFFQTSEADVYAIGDCAEFVEAPAPDRRRIEQVWYTGRMHGETLASNFCLGPASYTPGIWFNSAKFFAIEYQTYGIVDPSLGLPERQQFYWEHRGGKVAFRMEMDEEGRIRGAHNLGFRLRHGFFDRAIREKWAGEKVIAGLEEANFDPEFFSPYYLDIQKAYLASHGGFFPLPKQSFIQRLFGAGL